MTITAKTFLTILAILVLVTPSLAEQNKEAAAILAAETFLQEVDAGYYAASWDAAAQLLKRQVTRQQWQEQLERLRPLFGAALERKVQRTRYKTDLPGAPDGEYVVIQFLTAFENKKQAVETVTPMLDSDGQWRVTGYFIH